MWLKRPIRYAACHMDSILWSISFKPAYNAHKLSVLWFRDDMTIANGSSHVTNKKKYIIEGPVISMSAVGIEVFHGLHKCIFETHFRSEKPVLRIKLCWNEVYPLIIRSLFDQRLRTQNQEIHRVWVVWSILYKSSGILTKLKYSLFSDCLSKPLFIGIETSLRLFPRLFPLSLASLNSSTSLSNTSFIPFIKCFSMHMQHMICYIVQKRIFSIWFAHFMINLTVDMKENLTLSNLFDK